MTFLRQIIDEHEKQMLEDIENFQRQEIQQIQRYKIDLNNRLKYFDLHKNSLNLLISINDQIRLLKNKSTFLNYINQTNEQLEELQVPTGIDYHISGEGLSHTIKELIHQCVRVTESSKQIISMDEGPQLERLIAKFQENSEVDLSRQSLNDENIHIIIEILKKATVS